MDSVVEGRVEFDVVSVAVLAGEVEVDAGEVVIDSVVVVEAAFVVVVAVVVVVVVVVGSGQTTNSGQLQMSILESK